MRLPPVIRRCHPGPGPVEESRAGTGCRCSASLRSSLAANSTVSPPLLAPLLSSRFAQLTMQEVRCHHPANRSIGHGDDSSQQRPGPPPREEDSLVEGNSKSSKREWEGEEGRRSSALFATVGRRIDKPGELLALWAVPDANASSLPARQGA